MSARLYKPVLKIGDVLQAHPKETFWGCAVVLAVWPQTKEFGPLCHIGITNVVMRHEFSWTEIDQSKLSIIEFDRYYRTTPEDNRVKREVCIGQYANFGKVPLIAIATIDPLSIWSAKLTQDVGDGSGGNYPLCGKINESLGVEAVINWRRINDREVLEAEEKHADLEHFRWIHERKAN